MVNDHFDSGHSGAICNVAIQENAQNSPRAHRSQSSRSISSLTLEQVDGLGEVGGADVFGERRVLTLKGQIHFPGDAAIAEVAGGRGAEFADVLCFGEVHFEEAADARSEWEQVER